MWRDGGVGRGAVDVPVSAYARVRRAWRRWRWGVLPGAGVAAVLLGWWGYAEVFAHTERHDTPLDSLYYALGLFAFEGGRLGDEQVPAQLQAARFLAPMVLLAAAVGALLAVFHGELLRFRARRTLRDHVIIVGLDVRALRIARQLVAGRRGSCVIVDLAPADTRSTTARVLGVPVVTPDEADSDLVERDDLVAALRRAGAERAESVIVMTGARDLNARFAHVLVDLQAAGLAPHAFVETDDVDELRMVTTDPRMAPGTGTEWFSLSERAAKSLLDDVDGLMAVRGTEAAHQHLVVVGRTPVGRSLIVQAARNWTRDLRRRQGGGRPDDRLVMTLLDLDDHDDFVTATRAEERERRLLHARDPRVPLDGEGDFTLRVVAAAGNADTALTEALEVPPTAVVVTGADDDELLRHGLAVAARVDGVPVWLCTEREGGLVDLAAAGGDHPRAPQERRSLRPFHVLDTVVREDAVRRGIDEELARAVHQAHRRYRVESSGPRSPAGVAWDELAPAYRRLNREAVRAWRLVLQQAGFAFGPYRDLGAEAWRLPPAVVLEVAEALHAAWDAEKQAQGYRWGEARNDDPAGGPLCHPDIGRPFADLGPAGREWNVSQAEAVPEHLAAAGLQLVPPPGVAIDGSMVDVNAPVDRDDLLERLAEAYHDLYREQAGGRGEAGGLGVVGWDELDERIRSSNRSTAAAVPGYLGRMGLTMRARLGAPAPDAVTALDDDQVELGAYAEHERWVAERRDQGWVRGEGRDDDAVPPTHPSLVPWDDMDEALRDKDRVRIRAIPDLLARLGWEVVPQP